jgi:ABC-type polysaccharide/polyol phosphate export permease
MSAVLRVFHARELLWNLTLRELRTKYRRSFLGWAWSMLNPLATVAIYAFVFGVLFESNVPAGDPSGLSGFAYFLLCALLPWNFFSLIANLGMSSISVNAGLVRRVAFPREVLVFSNVLHACVQFSIELGLLCVVLLIAGSPILPWLPFVVLTSVLLAVFASGFALALSTLSVFFRDITYLWTIFVQVWFFLTPVVYAPQLVEDRAPDWVRAILELNPMGAFVTTFRDLLYDATWPSLGNTLTMVVAATVSIIAGWYVFLKMGQRLPEEV